ncbi:MAG: dGTP triphosphohydrolase [Verrucomicrobiota bacterium]
MRDRDRLIHASVLRRLEGITQVVSSSEGHVFHNRLTHSLKVAQIGRRLAEFLLNESRKALLNRWGGLDPEVVEAACLGHDLGHPPFGHMAEVSLNKFCKDKCELQEDGFEGNAQSFRVITKLGLREIRVRGLDLTRATLNAHLKYPWHRNTPGCKSNKWGAYSTEKADFDFARENFPFPRQSLEAAIMDWSDDIAYSVHDLEDFVRAGKIPLHRVIESKEAQNDFLNGIRQRWMNSGKEQMINEFSRYENAFLRLIEIMELLYTEPYRGTVKQEQSLVFLSSILVNRYINGVYLCKEYFVELTPIGWDQKLVEEVEVLKEFTWEFVIDDVALATQQKGQGKIIQCLSEFFYDQASSDSEGGWKYFPAMFRDFLQMEEDKKERARLAIDYVASMTEAEAIRLFQRISGYSIGSIMDVGR